MCAKKEEEKNSTIAKGVMQMESCHMQNDPNHVDGKSSHIQ